MKLEDAKQLALELMQTWECSDWTFKWSTGRRQLGAAVARYNRLTEEWTNRELRLSRHFVENNDVAAVTDTILHEIAHIKAGLNHGHNHVWRAWCLRVGARPERCATSDRVNMAPHTHELACGCCGRVFKRMFRKSRKSYKRHYCPTCGHEKSIGMIVCRQVTKEN